MSPRGGNCAEVNSVQSIAWCPSVTPALNEIMQLKVSPVQLWKLLIGPGGPSFIPPSVPLSVSARPVSSTQTSTSGSVTSHWQPLFNGNVWGRQTHWTYMNPLGGFFTVVWLRVSRSSIASIWNFTSFKKNSSKITRFLLFFLILHLASFPPSLSCWHYLWLIWKLQYPHPHSCSAAAPTTIVMQERWTDLRLLLKETTGIYREDLIWDPVEARGCLVLMKITSPEPMNEPETFLYLAYKVPEAKYVTNQS